MKLPPPHNWGFPNIGIGLFGSSHCEGSGIFEGGSSHLGDAHLARCVGSRSDGSCSVPCWRKAFPIPLRMNVSMVHVRVSLQVLPGFLRSMSQTSYRLHLNRQLHGLRQWCANVRSTLAAGVQYQPRPCNMSRNCRGQTRGEDFCLRPALQLQVKGGSGS